MITEKRLKWSVHVMRRNEEPKVKRILLADTRGSRKDNQRPGTKTSVSTQSGRQTGRQGRRSPATLATPLGREQPGKKTTSNMKSWHRFAVSNIVHGAVRGYRWIRGVANPARNELRLWAIIRLTLRYLSHMTLVNIKRKHDVTSWILVSMNIKYIMTVIHYTTIWRYTRMLYGVRQWKSLT